jgi:ribosomal protein L24E
MNCVIGFDRRSWLFCHNKCRTYSCNARRNIQHIKWA